MLVLLLEQAMLRVGFLGLHWVLGKQQLRWRELQVQHVYEEGPNSTTRRHEGSRTGPRMS